MTSIVRKVLSLDKSINCATDSYVDGIIVDTSQVSVQYVSDYLWKYGLKVKDPVSFSFAEVLGLQLFREPATNVLKWKRLSKIPVVKETMTKQELHSVCGQLVGHYPVMGWLRVACSYVKRLCTAVKWNDNIDEETMGRVYDMIRRVGMDDPVKGVWSAHGVQQYGRVWCDASCLAVGVCLEVGGEVLEDSSWLRGKNDYMHINIAELESILKGLNLALKWNMKRVEFMCDSVTVCRWLDRVMTKESRIQVSGMSEMLVKRRLQVFRETVMESDLDVTVTSIKSECNKADVLTRVPKCWLKQNKMPIRKVGKVCNEMYEKIRRLHKSCHFGAESMMSMFKNEGEDVPESAVKTVIGDCARCASIDPARWEKRSLNVQQSWTGLAIDVTHYGTEKYLTCVDCGPGRFAVWKRIKHESTEVVKEFLLDLFSQHGPPAEILFDNSATFRSSVIRELCGAWNISVDYRAAYRPSGHGVDERCHRTVKRTAARAGCSVFEAVYWYNMSPHLGECAAVMHCKYVWRNKALSSEKGTMVVHNPRFKVGDRVYVKPGITARCTSRWPEGTITKINSKTKVEVYGMPRHIADIRRTSKGGLVISDDEGDVLDGDTDGDAGGSDV